MNKQNQSQYVYKCTDDSILIDRMKIYFRFFYQFIPNTMTANTITLISSLAVWLMFAISIFNPETSSNLIVITFALLLHFQLIGDNLDGMRAKEAKSSSPLGEYLDHYFDVFSTALVIFIIINALNISSTGILLSLTWFMMFIFSATFMEEKVRGELYFGKIGPMELSLLISLFFISLAPQSGQHFWHATWLFDLENYWIFLFAPITLGSLLTLVGIKKRVKTIPIHYLLQACLSVFFLLMLSNSNGNQLISFFTLVFFMAEYCNRLLTSHLNRTKFPLPNSISTGILALIFLFSKMHWISNDTHSWLMILFFGYMLANVLFLFIRTFTMYKQFWSWTQKTTPSTLVKD